MGNHRFGLSDMIPNAWFYKLKDMSNRNNRTRRKKPQSSTTTTTSQKPTKTTQHNLNSSYNFVTTNTTQPNRQKPDNNNLSCYSPTLFPTKLPSQSTHYTYFPISPRKSTSTTRRTKNRRRTIYRPSPKLNRVDSSPPEHSLSASPDWDFKKCPVSETEEGIVEDLFDKKRTTTTTNSTTSWSNNFCQCRITSSNADIVIDMNNNSGSKNFNKFDELDMISGIELPPILTKPVKFSEKPNNVKQRKARRSPPQQLTQTTQFTGIKVRGSNTPRMGSKKIQNAARKSVSGLRSKQNCLSESLVVVKSSVDPEKDFRDSMVEMIVENNICGSKDLEDLLACYLSLNSKEYHDLIIKAFEQIWFDMVDLCV